MAGLYYNLNEVLYEKLSPLLETYPVVFISDGNQGAHIPYAVYHLKETGTKTKDCSARSVFEVKVLVWAGTYDEVVVKAELVKEQILDMESSGYGVTGFSAGVDFDKSEQLYFSEMFFTIKLF